MPENTSIIIKEGTVCITASAFAECSGLTSIDIPSSVTSIGSWAFDHCSSLTSVTIPDGITSIGDNTFSACSGLTSVSIPDGVTSIGDETFYGCSALTDVFCRAEKVPTTGDDVFEDSNIANATLHVPAGSVKAYKSAEPWSQFKEIVALEEEQGGGRYDAKYDLNDDGKVDAADVVMLVNFIAGK